MEISILTGEWCYLHHARTNFPAANAKTAASKTKPVMMQHMATGVPSENTARRAEEIMPLPYWSAPMSAAAEPVISSGTLESAAALEHAVIIPFVLHTKNMGMADPPQTEHTRQSIRE